MEGLGIPMLILKLLFRRLLRTDQEQARNVPLYLRTLQEKLKSFRCKIRLKTEVFRWASYSGTLWDQSYTVCGRV